MPEAFGDDRTEKEHMKYMTISNCLQKDFRSRGSSNNSNELTVAFGLLQDVPFPAGMNQRDF